MKKSLKPVVGPLLNADYLQMSLWLAGVALAVNDGARERALALASEQFGLDLTALLTDLLAASPFAS